MVTCKSVGGDTWGGYSGVRSGTCHPGHPFWLCPCRLLLGDLNFECFNSFGHLWVAWPILHAFCDLFAHANALINTLRGEMILVSQDWEIRIHVSIQLRVFTQYAEINPNNQATYSLQQDTHVEMNMGSMTWQAGIASNCYWHLLGISCVYIS